MRNLSRQTGMRSATTALGSFAGDSVSMSFTKSVLRFGVSCTISAAKVNHILHSQKVIGINENVVCRNHFDNFNNHGLRDVIFVVSKFKIFMRNVILCYGENNKSYISIGITLCIPLFALSLILSIISG